MNTEPANMSILDLAVQFDPVGRYRHCNANDFQAEAAHEKTGLEQYLTASSAGSLATLELTLLPPQPAATFTIRTLGVRGGAR